MSVYSTDEMDNVVAIDECHQYLLTALVASRKPTKILELGFGAGASCRGILQGLNFNGLKYDFKLVDCWLDFGGSPPSEILKPDYSQIEFVTSIEKEFIDSCTDTYDFIFSDADHHNTQSWVQYVYDKMLNEEGILIYHDVTNSQLFPNLLSVYKQAVRNKWDHMLFNYNSRADERCDRGLLVIFKH